VPCESGISMGILPQSPMLTACLLSMRFSLPWDFVVCCQVDRASGSFLCNSTALCSLLYECIPPSANVVNWQRSSALQTLRLETSPCFFFNYVQQVLLVLNKTWCLFSWLKDNCYQPLGLSTVFNVLYLVNENADVVTENVRVCPGWALYAHPHPT
jgi:hypothetical protein